MRFTSLAEWLAWQETLHPSEIELGLDRIRQVCRKLPALDPETTLIVVAGTNGKGSSVAMLEAIFLAAGFSVGTYSSPHLISYNERIRLNGVMASDDEICQAFEEVDRARDDISLTYFEFGTLAALFLLAQHRPDIAVLEVGLGGRLDAVNLVDADVSLITAIDLDHQDWLGNDRETIAGEKAGILRRGKPVVYADPRPVDRIRETAVELNAAYYEFAADFTCQAQDGGFTWTGPGGVKRTGLPLPSLRGAHQLVNASGVLMVCECLREQRPLAVASIREGLVNAQIPGRFQVFPGEITWVFDVAHNPAAVSALADNLRQLAQGRVVHAVMGVMGDKDIPAMIEILQPMVSHWYFTDLPTDRAARASQLAQDLQNLQAGISTSVEAAMMEAAGQTKSGEVVLVFGSFVTVAEALRIKLD